MSPDAGRDLVFVSYSHANPTWRDRLLVLLKPFVRQGHLQVWADPYIEAGALWRREIDAALSRACVGVVLLTPDLLASDFVTDVELPRLLRAARAGALTLLVVPIEAHAPGSLKFADGDLAEFQWPWNPAKPLGKLRGARRNQALVEVTRAIVKAAGLRPAERHAVAPPERIERPLGAPGADLGELYGVPKLPPHYVPRRGVLDALANALLGPSAVVGVSAAATVGVHGEGGLGKTVVAQSLAWDERARRAFPDGIYWLTVGQDARIEVLQAALLTWLGGSAHVADVPAGTRLLRDRLRGKACLVVLDDVWQVTHGRAFDVLGATSRLLVTTRDRSILTALGARDLRLDALSPDLARDLLARWSGLAVGQLPAEAAEIARQVDYLPLALSLAGAQIRDGGSWRDLLVALRQGDLIYLDHPYGSVFTSLQASVNALAPLDAARYLELAVFPEDVAVPVAVVEQLWRATSGDDAHRLRGVLTRLAARNLVQIVQIADGVPETGSLSRATTADTTSAIALHDLQHDFVRLLVEDVAALHARVIDAWEADLPRQPEDTRPADRWATLTSAPAYRWQYLAHHLRRAGRDQELERLLTSPDWLYARLTRSSVVSLLGDYDEAQADFGLQSIRDALRLSSHVLAKDATALSGQLAGRLLADPDPRVQSLLSRVPTTLRHRPMLRPVVACLTCPGAALLQTFEGHRGAVGAVAVLPDGQRALSASYHTLKLWDLTTGTIVQTLEGHREGVSAVTVLPDGERALSGSFDGTLKLWDVTTGTVLQTLEGHAGWVRAVAVLPDGQRALSGSDGGTLELWDLTTGTVLQTLEGHTDHITAVAVLPDGQRAFSGSGDGTLVLWDLTTGTVLQTLEGHTKLVRAVAVLPDGQRTLSGSVDGTLKLWDLTTGTVVQTLEGHTSAVRAVAVLPDGERALSGSDDGTLVLWDLTTGTVVQTLEGHTSAVCAVAVLPDGERALSGSDDGTLKLWDLTTGTVPQTREGHTSAVRAVAVLPDGQRALSGSDDGTLKLWDLTTGTVLQTREGHTNWVIAVAVLPDGQRALSSSVDGTLKLWDLTTGTVLQTLEGHREGVTAVAVLPDGSRALSGSYYGTLKLWDLTTGTVLQTLEGHTDHITAVAVLPDGPRALSGSYYGTLKLWDLTTGTVLQTLEGHREGVTAVAVLPVGPRALSGSYYGTLKLWDLTTGTVLQTLKGHTAWIRGVAVLPDGQRAVSGSDDGTLKLWDLTTGTVICTFYDEASVLCVSATTGDLRFVSGNGRGKLCIFKIENVPEEPHGGIYPSGAASSLGSKANTTR